MVDPRNLTNIIESDEDEESHDDCPWLNYIFEYLIIIVALNNPLDLLYSNSKNIFSNKIIFACSLHIFSSNFRFVLVVDFPSLESLQLSLYVLSLGRWDKVAFSLFNYSTSSVIFIFFCSLIAGVNYFYKDNYNKWCDLRYYP